MPKATAKWLINNTSLTFNQIAKFCGMHDIEIQGIADGDVADSVMEQNPVKRGFLTDKEVERCQENDSATLQMKEQKLYGTKKKKGAKYTPLARRQDKPDAIAWFVKHHPEIADVKIVKLVGTTKTTIEAIRNKEHWNTKNITPKDPVLLGICSQTELNKTIAEAEKLAAKAAEAKEK